ncbi:MAG: alpha/beta fold hydrolase [Deltaproteobacteria bacterium]|nr:alpha/beta fold hydrolase [Deltaproteobacteria bacterium]
MNVLPLRPCTTPFVLRNGHLQTFLASSRFRARGASPMLEAARDVVLAAGDGIRLLGSHSRHPGTASKGLVVLLHGWEGSINSTYMLCTGRALYRRGYEVFRLNLRDHGRSHHLNRGIFYAVLLDEVFEAIAQVAAAAAGLNVFLVGFSLGGNFALRIARRCATHPIPNLRQVVAVSAALDPEVSTARADRHPLIRRYFLKKWRRSLAIKQQLYPDLYDFCDILRLQTLREITDALLERYSRYPSARAYFQAYTLTGDVLLSIAVPTTLLTSQDDPIIPVRDYHELRTNELTRVVVEPHGGHNGFLDGPRLRSRYETWLADMFDGYSAARP